MVHTLNDSLFRNALLAGIEGAYTVSNLEVYLVGGGGIQYYASATPELRRPTIDVDLQSKIHTPVSMRNQWGRNTESRLKERELKGSYKHKKTKTGAEVRVETEDKKPFFVHLDSFTPKYIQEHQRIIDSSYERKRPLKVEGRKENVSYFV